MRLSRIAPWCLLGSSLLAAAATPGEQAPVSRFDLYTGFSDLNTPGLNHINQAGFHLQTGVNVSRWSSAGFDYSIQNGSSYITPALAPPNLQRLLAAELPAGYQLKLPFSATTQTFTGGGQVVVRHYHSATFFARPVLSAFHIRAVPHPDDPINTVVAELLVPHGHLTDWYGAFGGGGGAEFPVTRWLGARVQVDAAWNHPFSNILEHGSVSYRYSVGPAFHFGPKLRNRDLR